MLEKVIKIERLKQTNRIGGEVMDHIAQYVVELEDGTFALWDLEY
ncbi:hypothetical protein [Priestia koreensis]